MAMSPLSAGRQMMKRMFPSQSEIISSPGEQYPTIYLSVGKDIKQSGSVVSVSDCLRSLSTEHVCLQQSGEGDWEHGEDNQRRATFAHSGDGGHSSSATNSPVFLRRETVGQDVLSDNDRIKVDTVQHANISPP